jgi:hypothetical protein
MNSILHPTGLQEHLLETPQDPPLLQKDLSIGEVVEDVLGLPDPQGLQGTLTRMQLFCQTPQDLFGTLTLNGSRCLKGMGTLTKL